MVAFTTLQTRLFFPIGSLLGVQLEVQLLALFDRIFEYLDHEVDIVEGSSSSVALRGEVALDSVWFRYDDAAWTLQDVSFTVPPGTKTALVGETGSGKTTCAYPVARLYDATEGSSRSTASTSATSRSSRSPTRSGSSRRRRTSSTRRCARTCASRVRARPTRRSRRPRAAQIHELIATLPDGYDTMVGERGYRFSGGEKQRMAIARTILRNPPVLVLDEATSSLDTQTERLVQEALERLSEGRTTIAIAHRLSTVRDADQIVVLDRGRVVELGTYDDLLARGGRFAELVAGDRPSRRPSSARARSRPEARRPARMARARGEPRVEVDVRRHERDERHRERVDDAAKMLSSASGASVTKIRIAPSSGPATSATAALTRRASRRGSSGHGRARRSVGGMRTGDDPRARPPARRDTSGSRARSRPE